MRRATIRKRRLAAMLAERERARLVGDTARQVLDLEAAAPMRGGAAEPPAGGLFEASTQSELFD